MDPGALTGPVVGEEDVAGLSARVDDLHPAVRARELRAQPAFHPQRPLPLLVRRHRPTSADNCAAQYKPVPMTKWRHRRAPSS